MTKLQHIELFLDATYESDMQKRFIFNSRCICNFVERSLASLRFPSPYSRINIHCSKDSQATRVFPLEHEPYLEVRIHYELPSLDTLSAESLQRQFAKIILLGLEAASAHTPVPIDECSRALREFEAGGFLNRWLHLDKNWERWKCRSIISAELTMEHFTLDQSIYVGGQLAGERRIAETKPREGLFVEFLGDLAIDAQGIMKYKKKGKVLSAFDLQKKSFVD